jgi:hypothetical protein
MSQYDIAGGDSSNSVTQKINGHFNDSALHGNTDSPSFTGTPEAPTPDQNDDSDRIATTSFVQEKVINALNTKIIISKTTPTVVNGAIWIKY